MSSFTRRVLWLCLSVLADLAWAQGLPQQGTAEREQLVQRRQALVDSFRQDELRCREQFAVTGCIEAARERRRLALAPLREREMQLDALERQRRAEQRQQAIGQRLVRQPAVPAVDEPNGATARQGGGAIASNRAGAQGRRAQEAPAEAKGTVEGTALPRLRAPRKPLEGQPRADAALAAERRASEAQVRRERIDRRAQEHSKQGKPVRPLPVPEGSAATAKS